MYSEYFQVTSPHFGQWLVGLNKDQQQSLNDFSQNGLPLKRGRHEKLKCTLGCVPKCMKVKMSWWRAPKINSS